MSKFKIEKDVPLPERSRYPFREMEVGDSFFVPHSEVKRRTLSSNAGALNKIGRAFSIRNVQGGLRVWRTK